MDEHELLELVAAARKEGIYESDPDWDQIDQGLRTLGFDLPA